MQFLQEGLIMFPEPPLDPPDEDERTEEERARDEEAYDEQLISDWEDRMLDELPPDNWP